MIEKYVKITHGGTYNVNLEPRKTLLLESIKNFMGIEPFEEKLWLSTPSMHDLEIVYVEETFKKNWITTAGDNIKAIEREVAKYLGCKHAVALSCGTAALHLAVKLAGEEIYGQPPIGHGTLEGKKVLVV